MTESPKVLLCAMGRTPLMMIGRALRDEGFVVLPSRYHEYGIDGLARVEPHVALVQRGHEALGSHAFRAAAAVMGVRVFEFEFDHAAGAADADPTISAGQRVDDTASLDADAAPFPAFAFTGDCRALAGLLRDALTPVHSLAGAQRRSA